MSIIPVMRMSLSGKSLSSRSILSTEAVTMVSGLVFGLLSSACACATLPTRQPHTTHQTTPQS
jgi:hypothetical protein